MKGAARPAVTSGLDVLLSEKAASLRGERVGLIANAASVDSSLRGAVGLFRASADLDLRAMFGPEHGLDCGAQDMVPVPEGLVQGAASRSGSPGGPRVHSLYGSTEESLSPSRETLEDIDVLVGDLQDVGSRYYTFAATLALALEAIARKGGRLVVLDRPNPIGGDRVEGPGLHPDMKSFVGHIDVPVRHGLTMGELLAHHARRNGLSPSLEVVAMRGWSRSMTFEQTGLPWVPPSPNMPTPDTARVYPGTCLIEGTNLSEGRGTTRPFEWVGAPFLDAGKLASALDAEHLPGVVFRAHVFTPAFHKWSGRPCGGIAIHVIDHEAFLPVRTGVAIVIATRRLAPDDFSWRREPYEFVTDRLAIDLLLGGTAAREAIEDGADLTEIVRGWAEIEAAWRESRAGILLYR